MNETNFLINDNKIRNLILANKNNLNLLKILYLLSYEYKVDKTDLLIETVNRVLLNMINNKEILDEKGNILKLIKNNKNIKNNKTNKNKSV